MMKSLLREVGRVSSALLLLSPLGRMAPGAETPAAGQAPKKKASVARADFGRTADGQKVELFTLTNAHGIEVRAINYGGIIVSLRVPDRAGHLGDVVLGYDGLDGYLKATPYFGAIVGRYGNRIAKGAFTLEGRTYKLVTNNGPNHLHGGTRGFDKVVWKADPFDGPSGVGVVLTYTSPDGEEGYPGTLNARVTYTLTDRDELSFEYFATTDKATPINLTQHSYFNLAGEGTRDVLDHQLMIDADRYTPVDATKIPTGELAPVARTPFDFRTPVRIGAHIADDHPQIAIGGGYDHNFVLTRTGSGLQWAARVFEPSTGRTLTVTTTEPGLQLNTANALDGSITGKAGHVYRARYGLCLETQHFPDSPNQPAFPSTILRPGETLRSRTEFEFGVRR